MDGSSAVSVTLGFLMIDDDGNDISCMCRCVDVGLCDSVTVVALDTHHQPPSRQYSRWLFLSLSLDKLSGVAPHHQACPRCLSVLLIASLRPPPPPPQ